jgi:hypothetical protein
MSDAFAAGNENMETIKIIGLVILAAVIYGIIHDQITARLCLEYFTVFHPDIFHTRSPTLLGVGWGIWATWWVGLFLGIPLALAARAGKQFRRSARSLIKPLGAMMLTTAVFALLTGTAGYLMERNGTISLSPDWNNAVAPDHRPAFVADWFAHVTSYIVGFICGLILCISVAVSRRNTAKRAKSGR